MFVGFGEEGLGAGACDFVEDGAPGAARGQVLEGG